MADKGFDKYLTERIRFKLLKDLHFKGKKKLNSFYGFVLRASKKYNPLNYYFRRKAKK